jgi:hypothetical protein
MRLDRHCDDAVRREVRRLAEFWPRLDDGCARSGYEAVSEQEPDAIRPLARGETARESLVDRPGQDAPDQLVSRPDVGPPQRRNTRGPAGKKQHARVRALQSAEGAAIVVYEGALDFRDIRDPSGAHLR